MLKLLIVMLVLNAGPLGAQCDTAYIRVQNDSILKKHLSLASQRTVTAYQRRALARLDSIIAQQCARPSVPQGTTSLGLWATGRLGVLRSPDSTIVCAAVHVNGGAIHLGRSTVTVRFVSSDRDFIIDDPVTRDSVELKAICRVPWAASSETYRQGLPWGPIANAPLIAVTWTLARVQLHTTDENRTLVPLPAPVP